MQRKPVRMRGIGVVVGVAGILLVGGAARADIGPKPTTTGLTIGPGKDLEGIEVTMAAEDVKLRLTKVEEEKDRLEVIAVFTMRNPGPAATFETGFPVGIRNVFHSFSIKVDGKKIDFDLVNRAAASSKGRSKGPRLQAEAGPGDEPDYWYVWNATYPEGESRHEVRYVVSIVRHNLSGFTGYVLHTGAAWKGPIGKATVALTFGTGYSPDHVLSISPTGGARREKDRYVWDLSDLEPTVQDDIDIVYSTRSNAADLKSAKAEAKVSWVGHENLVRLLARRPGNWLRARMTPEELDEYLDALDGMVSEGKERDGRLVFPAKDSGGGRREYISSPDTLLQWIEPAAEAAEQYPESAKAQKVLARFVALGEKFQAGRLLVGGKVLEPPSGPFKDPFNAKFSGWMEKARKALKDEGR